MGQGMYKAVGFGLLGNPAIDVQNAVEEFEALGKWEAVVDFAYEAEPRYAAIFFGVDEPCLQLDWGLGDLPPGTPSVRNRTAAYIDGFAAAYRDGFYVPPRVKALWGIFAQNVITVSGVRLPEGRAISISDFH